jgi:hypothetical protein
MSRMTVRRLLQTPDPPRNRPAERPSSRRLDFAITAAVSRLSGGTLARRVLEHRPALPRSGGARPSGKPIIAIPGVGPVAWTASLHESRTRNPIGPHRRCEWPQLRLVHRPSRGPRDSHQAVQTPRLRTRLDATPQATHRSRCLSAHSRACRARRRTPAITSPEFRESLMVV